MLRNVLPEGRRTLTAHAFNLIPARYYQPTYRNIAETVTIETGAFLDVGCGPGWLCVHVASGKPELDAIGIDNSQTMIDLAERNKGPRLNITYRKMDAAKIVYPDATFDMAIALQTAHHWEDPAAILAELHRVMKPGGSLFIYEADSDATEVPDGWVQRQGPWPPDAVVLRGWRRYGMDAAAWDSLKQAVLASPFGGGQDGRHGPFRRLVLTRS